MSTKTFCDKCKKEKGQHFSGWTSFRVYGGQGLNIEELRLMITDFELCPECAKITLPKIIKVLKK